ncbi:Redoxin [alpha proteobacterium HIMB5]|nr:Redoxin [alpha proteobacterium HIMB5]
MRILILYIFLLANAVATENAPSKNIVINDELKVYDNLYFFDQENKRINLDEFRGKFVLLNFWAIWCAPCKEEMPSLDKLKENKKLNNIEIFPINVGNDSIEKSKEFFKDLNIKNLKAYFDPKINLARELSLRGVPTSVLVNKNGEEFARIIGIVDFEDPSIVDWLSKYN